MFATRSNIRRLPVASRLNRRQRDNRCSAEAPALPSHLPRPSLTEFMGRDEGGAFAGHARIFLLNYRDSATETKLRPDLDKDGREAKIDTESRATGGTRDAGGDALLHS